MGQGLVQLVPRIQVLPIVLPVKVQRGPCPILGSVQVVIVGLIVAEVVGEFSPDDGLLNESGDPFA